MTFPETVGLGSERIYEMRSRHRTMRRENEMTILCFLGIRCCISTSGKQWLFSAGKFSACSREKIHFAKERRERRDAARDSHLANRERS